MHWTAPGGFGIGQKRCSPSQEHGRKITASGFGIFPRGGRIAFCSLSRGTLRSGLLLVEPPVENSLAREKVEETWRKAPASKRSNNASRIAGDQRIGRNVGRHDGAGGDY